MKNMSTRTKFRSGASFLFILIMISLLFFYQFESQAVQKDSEIVQFVVDKGMSRSQIVDKLAQEKLVKSGFFTKIRAKLIRNRKIASGTYHINKSWDSETIIEHLFEMKNASGNNEISIRIPESSWAKDFAKLISSETDTEYDRFIELWNDEAYLKTLIEKFSFIPKEILENESAKIKLEGFLYPDTYRFYESSTEEMITEKILENSMNKYKMIQDSIDKSDLSVYDLMTLASIVEYEANTTEDMALIAGVFRNRLAIDMRLQSSVTICYSLYEFDSWLECESSKNNQYDSPYNTYVYLGLPPGPILNPSIQAIKATVEFTQSDYYFFLADVYGDGKIYYSETLTQHNIYKEQYLNGKS